MYNMSYKASYNTIEENWVLELVLFPPLLTAAPQERHLSDCVTDCSPDSDILDISSEQGQSPPCHCQ